MSHTHSHQGQPLTSLNRAFLWGIALNSLFVIAEFIAGYLYDSVGLISDAGHNLSDVGTLLLSLFAFRIAQRKRSTNYTYGLKKSTILVSLFNAVLLLLTVAFIIYESVERYTNPQPIKGEAIAWVAGIGILVNTATALLFMRQKNRDLNVKGAYLHMAADALVSLAIVISGIVIAATGWYLIDPIMGLLVASVILYSTWGLLQESLRLSLDGVPAEINLENIDKLIREVPQVVEVHHIHLWAISTTENAFTAHIVITDFNKGVQELKEQIRNLLEKNGISHCTLEFELKNENCDCECQ
ncbi:MAG: cation diffusion facilitator family transporter [Bacteroidaceae bacterium]